MLKLVTRLKAHHSKDLPFIRKIYEAMANMDNSQGWLCGNCRKMKSPQAWFCDSCGQPWEDCVQSTRRQASQPRQNYSDGSQHGGGVPWGNSGWTDPSTPGNGQRPRRRSRRKPKQAQQHQQAPVQGGQGQGYGTGKGQGKQKGKTQVLAPLPPPTGPPPAASWDLASAPWMTVPPAPPSQDPPTSGESTAEQTLRLIALQMQQNPDAVTPEVQALVQRHKTLGKKQFTKELHSAIKDLGQARQSLDTAVNARSALMARWRSFLNASLKQWKDYTEMFQSQEKACQEQIAAAREAVAKAKEDFAAKQTEDTQEISDGENDMVEGASKEASSRILGGMQHMTSGLQQLSEEAEKVQMEEEARQAKRPRKADTVDDDMAEISAPSSALGAKALQPFATPGQ